MNTLQKSILVVAMLAVCFLTAMFLPSLGVEISWVMAAEQRDADLDKDGDVDASDQAIFAADYGRTDCATGDACEGDFDGDGDVDGSDLAVFSADFAPKAMISSQSLTVTPTTFLDFDGDGMPDGFLDTMPGGIFSADVYVEGIPANIGLQSMGLQFTYDPALVSVTSLTNDAAWFLPVAGLPAIDNDVGLAELGAGKIPGTPGPDPILLGRAEFQCIGPGLTQLVMGELFPHSAGFDSMVLADGTILDKIITYVSAVVNQGPIPLAAFSAAPIVGLVPLTVNFTDESLGSIDLWEWDFGDGSPLSNDQNPTHTYKHLGEYTVTLIVYSSQGSDTETKTNYISVGCPSGVYTISGYVLDSDGLPIEGVTVEVEADTCGGPALTDTDGYYEFLIPRNWTGTVKLMKAGYSFNPYKRTYTEVTTDQVDHDYIGRLDIGLSGLVAYYPFNDTADDHSGYNNHGTVQEGVNFTQGIFGHGLDLQLPPSTEAVIVPDSDTLDTDYAFTLSAWVNPSNYRSDGRWNHHYIISKWKGWWPPGDYQLLVDANQPQPSLLFRVGNNDSDPVYDFLRSRTTIPKDEWSHVTVTFYNGLMRIFINGKKDAEKVSAKVTHTTLGEYDKDYIPIGGHYVAGEGNYNFEGHIDEVRIYNRALFDGEVQQLYAYELPAANRSHSDRYAPGKSFEACIAITHQGTLSALGAEETVPDGWTFGSVSGDDPPPIYPATGATASLEFAWITPPQSPVAFCYTVQVPSDETRDKTLFGKVFYREDGGPERTLTILPDPDPILSCTYHSGDYNPSDWSFSLSELLRGIQFYNVGSYHCDPLGEDTYNPGAGDQSCTPHNSDYNPQDWSINLSELLRAIQFYNVGSYQCDPAGEDGYAPGIAASSMVAAILAEDVLDAFHCAAYNLPGNDSTVNTRIDYEGTLTAVGLEVDLPQGWTFVSAGGDDAPEILPSVGATGTLGFAWVTPPASPIDFTYTVSVPADTPLPQQLKAKVKYRRLGGEKVSQFSPYKLTFGGCKGDFNTDGDVDGTDLSLFAAEFGKSNCNWQCTSDFDCDGDVDGSDLADFAAEFGRTDCL
jgi:PKD repeat protein